MWMVKISVVPELVLRKVKGGYILYDKGLRRPYFADMSPQKNVNEMATLLASKVGWQSQGEWHCFLSGLAIE